MSQVTALRAAVLAAVTLVAAAIALALTTGGSSKSRTPAGAGTWYRALAAPYTPSTKAKRGACGALIAADTIGVAHPVLPCGVKVFVRYGKREVLTQVIDRGPKVPGREFDLTRALASELGVVGTQTIEWRFAR
jgi:rare lipoprotein A (peptidoglycan hydrolase)